MHVYVFGTLSFQSELKSVMKGSVIAVLLGISTSAGYLSLGHWLEATMSLVKLQLERYKEFLIAKTTVSLINSGSVC